MSNNDEKIRVARYNAFRAFPYLATALQSMQMVKLEKFPTMGVDQHWRCYYCPKTISEWSDEAVATVLIHEVWHLLRKHHKRKGHRQANPWNVATDCEINDDLSNREFPFPGIFPQSLNPPQENGKLAEEYYNGLPVKEIKLPEYGGSCSDGEKREWEYSTGSNQGNNDEDDPNRPPDYAPGLNDAEAERVIKQTAEQIKDHAKKKGSVPNGMSVWADYILKPAKVDWKKELRCQLGAEIKKGKEDFSYSRINNRRSTKDIVLPGSIEYTPSIVVIADTSGSMSDEGETVLSEVAAILKKFDDVKVISCDADVHNIQRAKSIDHLKFLGGGGSNLRPAIEKADKMKVNVILSITDGYIDYNVKPTRAKQITLITDENGRKCPYGKNIYV